MKDCLEPRPKHLNGERVDLTFSPSANRPESAAYDANEGGYAKAEDRASLIGGGFRGGDG